MKNLLFLLVSFCSITSCSKSENNLPTILGKWTGVEVQTDQTNGVITNEATIDFEINFKENGEGTFKNSFFPTLSEIHWVWDELENKAWIIREIVLSTGDEITSYRDFKIEKNTQSEQIWVDESAYTNSNNESVLQISRWTFSK